MSNRICPICDRPWSDGENPVPYEYNSRMGTLMFCSGDCKKEYKINE